MRIGHAITAGAVVLAAFVLFLSMATAHDHGPGAWINDQRLTDPVSAAWCCNLNDCREETDNVEVTPGGYLIKSTQEVIETKRVIWRSPGGWWRCRNLATGTTRCLIGPPNGADNSHSTARTLAFLGLMFQSWSHR